MAKLTCIYTRTGDDGTTGLVGGARIEKDAPRVRAYGAIDETMAHIGMCRTLAETAHIDLLIDKLAVIQHELFDIGSQLATPPDSQYKGLPVTTAQHVTRLEECIDLLSNDLPELRSFILPGGSLLNASLHIARTVCRRAEQEIIALSREEHVSQEIRIYVNRLSDLLFVMSRYAAHKAGAQEYLWVPGKSNSH
jgi:cob(I)alamin adenosyltransferase